MCTNYLVSPFISSNRYKNTRSRHMCTPKRRPGMISQRQIQSAKTCSLRFVNHATQVQTLTPAQMPSCFLRKDRAVEPATILESDSSLDLSPLAWCHLTEAFKGTAFLTRKWAHVSPLKDLWATVWQRCSWTRPVPQSPFLTVSHTFSLVSILRHRPMNITENTTNDAHKSNVALNNLPVEYI